MWYWNINRCDALRVMVWEMPKIYHCLFTNCVLVVDRHLHQAFLPPARYGFMPLPHNLFYGSRHHLCIASGISTELRSLFSLSDVFFDQDSRVIHNLLNTVRVRYTSVILLVLAHSFVEQGYVRIVIVTRFGKIERSRSQNDTEMKFGQIYTLYLNWMMSSMAEDCFEFKSHC